MPTHSSIGSLTDAAPIILLSIEAAILLIVIGLWLIKLHAFQQLPDVKAERKVHYLSKQLKLLVTFATVLLGSLALGVWFLGNHMIETLQALNLPTTSISKTSTPHETAVPSIEPSAILDIFETSIHGDMTLETLKTRYENALSGAYILHHCERASKQEIDALLGALRDDISALQTRKPEKVIDVQSLYASIVSAAEGSYHMIYANMPCDTPQVAMLEQQFANFIMKYQANRK